MCVYIERNWEREEEEKSEEEQRNSTMVVNEGHEKRALFCAGPTKWMGIRKEEEGLVRLMFRTADEIHLGLSLEAFTFPTYTMPSFFFHFLLRLPH